jgi:3-oxoacyl-[acyl-carrier protein] reductase
MGLFPEGRVALVTGGSRGIGRAICLRLARSGLDIWLNYRSDHDAARAVQEQIRELGRQCELLCFDIADPDAVSAGLDPWLARDTPYAVVNNAGIVRDTLMVWMGQDEWHDVLRTTLDGFFHVTKKVLPGMLLKREGRIVNISSTSGQAGRSGQVNYATAKAGLIGATKTLAVEVGRRGILVNAVAPGFVETDMTAGVPIKHVLPAIPLGRAGKPEEVAGIVAFLCSADASYITGAVINCNGGLYV